MNNGIYRMIDAVVYSDTDIIKLLILIDTCFSSMTDPYSSFI